MILGFKESLNFKQKILAGIKKHTLRTDKKDRWKAGRIIHMATGVRTKAYNQFNKHRKDLSRCISTQKVEIFRYLGNQRFIKVDDRALGFEETKEFAISDGFDNWEAIFDWFTPVDKSKPIEEQENYWEGKVIHWTNKKY